MRTRKKLDLFLEEAKNGNIESAKKCLDSHIPVYALPTMFACYDHGFNTPEIIERKKYWEDCDIVLLGRTMKEYSIAFQKMLTENISIEKAFGKEV